MMVTFISQCEKNALKKTRRVLDAFANRIGDNTWQTIITEDGLTTVKKMLRQTASKSTAVSCHWIRSRSRSQFLWVVGSKSKFNEEGVVPVNRTNLELSHKERDNGWSKLDVITYAAGFAGLFHDFGKANRLFQKKLQRLIDSKSEPLRHEWLSLCLFEHFVRGKSDQTWLKLLSQINQPETAKSIEQQLLSDIDQTENKLLFSSSPFKGFTNEQSFAKLVAWLIVSHHRLPFPQKKELLVNLESQGMDKWLSNAFSPIWNSHHSDLNQWDDKLLKQNKAFDHGTPFISQTWQKQARTLAIQSLRCPHLQNKDDWFAQRFIAHMSRLSLMLADHYYSSLDLNELERQREEKDWRDNQYAPQANTDKSSTKKAPVFKQKLDEHCVGVSSHAIHFVKNLPELKFTLPHLEQHKAFTKSAPKPYTWQNKAYKQTQEYASQSKKQGFFGINMASTGCGKTIANARIMYALANEKQGCRFTTAVGLRTLTLQTGDSYRDLLDLDDSKLAVLIGSNAVKQLHQLQQENETNETGSESSDDYFEQLSVDYAGEIYDNHLSHWLKNSPKLEKLISAPVVVSTIDHLMPATESLRGGKQIAPMLRLLTSDLVLDEPDDFGLEDIPALCRLVNWAGVLGSRVLLSSATLPSSLVGALFSAYKMGREHFNQANFTDTGENSIVCGWFDEDKSTVQEVASQEAFEEQNKIFIKRRVSELTKKEVLRKGELIYVDENDGQKTDIKKHPKETHRNVAQTIFKQIHASHQRHHVVHHSGRKISIGVVRMANIDNMMAVTKCLMEMSPKEDHGFYYCVYHSQFPMALRSYKEQRLDQTLSRHDESALWQQPEIEQALANSTHQNLIFIVIGTSVVEVGRDHDYDWAIAEPSSLRSLIQLAGRIQRHRKIPPDSPNVSVLNKNIRALNGESVAYCKPGFETDRLPLGSHNLSELLTNELDSISAISRIDHLKITGQDFRLEQGKKAKAVAINSLLRQEHRALKAVVGMKRALDKKYYQNDDAANLWWEESKHSDWNGVLISKTLFRESAPQEENVYGYFDDEQELTWQQQDTTQRDPCWQKIERRVRYQPIELAEGNYWWLETDLTELYSQLSERLKISEQRASQTFGVINLRKARGKDEDLRWDWNEHLGVFRSK